MQQKEVFKMTYNELKSILLDFDKAELCFPFDEKTAVFKVSGKMFALAGMNNNPLSVNLKCDPEDALLLRSQFEAINPGYHMNKDHWNTITLDGSLDRGLLLKLIEDSYLLVIYGLPKRDRIRLGFK